MARIRNRRRRLSTSRSLETLEARCLLAGDTLSLSDDRVTVYQNSQSIDIDVLENDEFGAEYDGAREITAVSFGTQGGQLEISEDRRSISYAPPADFAGQEQFSYFVDGAAFATVFLNIQSPLGADEFRITPDGQVRSLDLLKNDPFWKDYQGAREITLISVTSGGSEIEISPDKRGVLYRPSENASGVDRFVYIVDEIYSTTVTIETPAVLQSDNFEVIGSVPRQPLDVLENDPFWRNYDGPRRITFVSQSQYDQDSVIEMAGDGRSVSYTPSTSYFGYDQFFYVVDGKFEAQVSVNVKRPVVDDVFEIDISSQDHFLPVLTNDKYWSSDRRRYVDVIDQVTSVGLSENGATVTVAASGNGVIYSAPSGFVGLDTFTYFADQLHEATVSVNVTRPVRDDYVTALQDTPNQRLPVEENDFLGNGYLGPRELTDVSASREAADLAIVDGSIQYTPPTSYVGGDSFTYTVDGDLEANVSVSVIPLAQGDWYDFCVQPDQTHALNVLANDHFRQGYEGAGRITSARIVDGGGDVAVSSSGRALIFEAGSSPWTRIAYVVDGKYEGESSVRRDGYLDSDQLVVDQNSAGTRVDVLGNDFVERRWGCSAQQYTGQRLITGATQSEQGGTVRVAADGRSVSYEPAEDFYGSDQFTYAVDGAMEAIVRVQVVRRVLDDQVRVRPGTTDKLSVIANDLFGADYQGAQQITDVTPSTVGATVQIAADGRSLIYTAPSDFRGTETLTYTVDGRLKAQVEVAVRPDGATPYPEFESLEEFKEFLIQDALARYEWQFGQESYSGYLFRGESADFFGSTPDSSTKSDGGRDFSETNVQVAGIDEGDIVEFDADYIYSLAGNDVVILDAWPAEELHEVSRTPIKGETIAQYLNGDRLTVISQVIEWPDYPWPILFDDVEPATDRGVAFDIGFPIGPVAYETIVTVLDVADRSAPSQVQQTTFEGQYIQSRGIGDYVYVALSNQAIPPGPRLIPDPESDDDDEIRRRIGVYETKEQYLERVQANVGEYIEETLPNYSSVGPDGTLARSGLIHEPEDIFKPITDGASSLVSLISIDVKNTEPGLADTSGVYTNGATTIYASLDRFYIFENGYEPGRGSVTKILQFDWNQNDGSARFSATGSVPGYMLNQFSADQYEGDLRIVTTVSHSYAGNWTSSTENDLFVLRDDGGTLEFVGSLQNLGVDETARSVRFMGPRAFVVTYRDVDPLFGLDVSDPTNPKALGHLTLPGFSSYMQLIDEDRLLTVGRNTPNGFAGPAQVSLFDVSDISRPRLIDEYTMERFSSTEAAVDPHAFGYFARHGLLAVPSTRSFIVRTDEDQDGYAEASRWVTENDLMVFRIDTESAPGTNQGIQLVAEISHDSPVRRSGYIDDVLYSIADDSINVTRVDDPGTILATVDNLRQDDTTVPPPEIVLLPAAGMIGDVRQDLAARLEIAPGAVMSVVAEQTDQGWQSVVRVEDTYYRYQGDVDSLRLTAVGFEFSTAGQQVSWQNGDQPADVNNDGQVTPGDAILIIDRLAGRNRETLADQTVLRQVQDAQQRGGPFWDVNGDGIVSPIDVLLVANRVNEISAANIDTGDLSADNPSTLDDTAAVDALFRRVRETAGDANLDGRFDSSDLVQIFQAGEYENDVLGDSLWEDGDWNGDGEFTSADLVLAFSHGQFKT